MAKRAFTSLCKGGNPLYLKLEQIKQTFKQLERNAEEINLYLSDLKGLTGHCFQMPQSSKYRQESISLKEKANELNV